MNRILKTCVLLLGLSLPLSAQVNQNINPNNPYQKMSLAAYIIQQFYVDKVDDNKVVEAALTAMAKELDPHSEYMNKEEVKALNEPMQGNFEGIGVQFNMLRDTLFIVQTISGAPAEKVGIRAGDRIIYVSDTLIAGVKMVNQDIMKRLKGPKGSTVKVKILRSGVPDLIEFEIVRDKIPLYSLDATYMLDKENGYIKVNRFTATTHKEFLDSLTVLRKQGMKNLILDLDGNGGGLLGSAINIADEFLSDGQEIVYTEGRQSPREDAKATERGVYETGKLVVLVDETSASASEIVSGAIQDWDRGVIVGRRTFGKGLVQRPFPLPDGTMLKLTVARYYTPSGRCVQKPFDDNDKYELDLETRFEHGEMIHADSIHFPDSLKRETKINKRVVYGGGGIMPDIFVPLDTNRVNAFHRNLIAKNCLNGFVLTYSDAHKKELRMKYPTFDSFYRSFKTSDAQIKELVNVAKKESVVPKDNELEESTPLLKLQIKALMARDLWSMNEYFQVINSENESLQKALSILSKKGEYESILKGKK